ncbi:hypothetical protein PT276_06935 [Orbaceae bacterium ESL0721]|nr:hypothetical protein [Orbaceae bacterium ESL0721]
MNQHISTSPNPKTLPHNKKCFRVNILLIQEKQYFKYITFTFSDIKNSANYKVDHVSLSVGTSN